MREQARKRYEQGDCHKTISHLCQTPQRRMASLSIPSTDDFVVAVSDEEDSFWVKV